MCLVIEILRIRKFSRLAALPEKEKGGQSPGRLSQRTHNNALKNATKRYDADTDYAVTEERLRTYPQPVNPERHVSTCEPCVIRMNLSF
jgi:hypothetical protein